MLASSGDIDRLNRTIADGVYPRYHQALVDAAVAETLQSGTAVQCEHAARTYTAHAPRLRPRCDDLTDAGRKELGRLTDALLDGRRLEVQGPEKLDYVRRVEWRYGVEALSTELDEWRSIHTHVYQPWLAEKDGGPSYRRVDAVGVVLGQDGLIARSATATRWLVTQLEDFEGEIAEDFLTQTGTLHDSLGPDGRVVEAVAGALGQLDPEQRRRAARSVWPVVPKGLRAVTKCEHFSSLLRFLDRTRPLLEEARAAREAGNEPPGGVEPRSDDLVQQLGAALVDAASGGTRSLTKEDTLRVLSHREDCAKAVLALSDGNPAARRFEVVAEAALVDVVTRANTAERLQRFLESYPMHKKLDGARVAFVRQRKHVTERTLASLRRATRPAARVTARRRHQSYRYCDEHEKRPDGGRQCVKCSVRTASGYLVESSACRYGVVSCLRWEATTTSGRCLRHAVSKSSWTDLRLTQDFAVRNPTRVPIRVTFEWKEKGARESLKGPVKTVRLDPGQRKRVKAKSEVILRSDQSPLRITGYRIAAVELLLRGD